jgi:hypothetical protein
MARAAPQARTEAGLLSLRIDLPQGRIGPDTIDLLEAFDRVVSHRVV